MVALLVLASIGHEGWPLQPHLKSVTVVFLVVQTAGFSIGFAPIANVVATEVTALRLRDMTQRFASCSNVLGK